MGMETSTTSLPLQLQVICEIDCNHVFKNICDGFVEIQSKSHEICGFSCCKNIYFASHVFKHRNTWYFYLILLSQQLLLLNILLLTQEVDSYSHRHLCRCH